jgi:integrative and conjugative element protein (TIGR02256 family)
MTALVFEAGDGQLVKLGADAVRLLHAFRQTAPDAYEAGGVLLGRWIESSDDVVVDQLTTPMRGDRRTRFSFYRDRIAHQRRIDEVFASSDGTCGYLGEWHTHPERDPEPSRTDVGDWRRRLRQDRVDVPFVFFLIVGLVEIRVWRGSRSRLAIERTRATHVFDEDP